jgi:hypothetical protein
MAARSQSNPAANASSAVGEEDKSADIPAEPVPVAQAIVVDEEVGTENQKLKIMERENQKLKMMERERVENEEEILRHQKEDAMICTEEKKRRNKCRMYIFIVVVIIAGVGAYIGTRGSSTDDAEGEPTPIADQGDSPTAATSFNPTTSPTGPPSELILYDAPTPEDCEKIAAGVAVEGEDELLERSFNMLINIQLTAQTDIQVLLLDFQDRFQQVLVLDLAGCLMQNNTVVIANEIAPAGRSLQDNPYKIANGIVTAGVFEDMASQVESETCHAAIVNLLLKLRGEERMIALLGIILEVEGEKDLEEKLQLGPPFDQITVIQVSSIDLRQLLVLVQPKYQVRLLQHSRQRLPLHLPLPRHHPHHLHLARHQRLRHPPHSCLRNLQHSCLRNLQHS